MTNKGNHTHIFFSAKDNITTQFDRIASHACWTHKNSIDFSFQSCEIFVQLSFVKRIHWESSFIFEKSKDIILIEDFFLWTTLIPHRKVLPHFNGRIKFATIRIQYHSESDKALFCIGSKLNIIF